MGMTYVLRRFFISLGSFAFLFVAPTGCGSTRLSQLGVFTRMPTYLFTLFDCELPIPV